MRVLALACGILGASTALTSSATAQPDAVPAAVTAAPANPSVRALVRGVNDATMVRSLDVRKLDVRVRLRGALAETTIEMQVFATTPEAVEGRVHIDLPAGSIVTGYALDVGGAMIDGTLVDAPKAKAAYEQNLRRNVDPGLAEIDQAGGFNTRVSPIDDKQGRTIRLTFVSPVGAKWELPLNASASGGWTVRVDPVGSQADYRIALGTREASAALDAHGSGRLDGALRIAATGADEAIASRHPTGEIYWQVAGSLPPAHAAHGGTLRILWDRSRSRRDQDHEDELNRVAEALAALAPRRIEWLAFSSGKVQRSNLLSAAEVAAKANVLSYAGATSFQSIAHGAPVDTCLLISDGRATLDQAPLETLPCRLFAIVSDRGADWAGLSALASANGGQLVETGARPVDWNAASVEAVTDSTGKRLDFTPLPAPPGQWRIALRAPGSGPAQIRVGGTTVERLPAQPAEAFGGEGTVIAGARLAGLSGSGARKDFVALSRRYSVASPSLSFAVLETPQDYVRNDITPPANYARMTEWREMREEADEDAADAKARRFDELLDQWNEQVAWWQKNHDLATRRTMQPAKGGRPMVVPSPVASAPLAAPPPPPPPPPPNGQMPAAPPPPPRVSAERDGGDEGFSAGSTVVTGSRVAQPNLTSASPVTVLSSQEVRLSGTTRTEDLINSLPQSFGGDVKISASAVYANRDYIVAFDADPGAFDRLFPEWERKAGDVPAFYLDTADWLSRHNRKEQAVETLLSALDLPTADLVTVGMVAGRLERYGMLDEAVALRERQAQLDPDRPQPKRLLALVLARRAALGGPGAKADLDRAVRLLVDIAINPVDDRWEGADLIALVEVNALIPKLRALGGRTDLDPRLIRNLASDVRVVLDWSNDAADIDLWVDEPTGERAIFNNPLTRIGGHLSNDMTEGYGPEEYLLRRAATGRYIVRANVYSPDRLDPNGPSRVTAHLYRDWGRPTQREESIDLDLTKGIEGEVRIGTLRVAPKQPVKR